MPSTLKHNLTAWKLSINLFYKTDNTNRKHQRPIDNKEFVFYGWLNVLELLGEELQLKWIMTITLTKKHFKNNLPTFLKHWRSLFALIWLMILCTMLAVFLASFVVVVPAFIENATIFVKSAIQYKLLRSIEISILPRTHSTTK